MNSVDFGKNGAKGKHTLQMPQPFNKETFQLEHSLTQGKVRPLQYVSIFKLIFIVKRNHVIWEKCKLNVI